MAIIRYTKDATIRYAYLNIFPDQFKTRFKETYAGLKKQDQIVREKRVRMLTPDVALVMAVGEGTYTDAAGWTSDPVGIGLTIVFVRDDGAWRARHAHQSIAP